MEAIQRLSLAGFTLDVFFDAEITFFSAVKEVDEMITLLLVWKNGDGFSPRLVLKDPNSDAETTRPLTLDNFPINALIDAIKSAGENVPRHLAEPLIGILQVVRSGEIGDT